MSAGMFSICTLFNKYNQGLTSANVGDQVTNAPLLEQLGEKSGPVGLHTHTSRLDKGGDVVSLQFITRTVSHLET